MSTGANNVNLPGSFSLQLLVKPEVLAGSPAVIGYAVNQQNNGTNRGYLLATGPAGATGPNQSFRSILGGPTFDGVDPVNPYTPGHWYYMAMTFKPSGVDTLIDTYYADLTAGDKALTHVSQLETGFIGTSSGSGRNAPVWLGIFQDNQQAGFSGTLDEIALFNSVLSESTIQAMFNSLQPPLAPEPGSIVLMAAAMAGLGFAAWRAKSRRAV